MKASALSCLVYSLHLELPAPELREQASGLCVTVWTVRDNGTQYMQMLVIHVCALGSERIYNF
jgi:hypothetical protein